MSTNSNFDYCFSLLKENDEIVEKDARLILTKMCDNIIQNPNEAKYRKVRIANSTIEKKLMPAMGAIECLFAAGFIENDDGFLLPLNSSLAGIKELKNLLGDSSTTDSSKSISTEMAKSTTSKNISEQNTQSKTQPIVQNNPEPSTSKMCLTKEDSKRTSFFESIIGHFRSVLRYEDAQLQQKVIKIVPKIELEIAAIQKLRKFQKHIKQNNSNSDKSTTLNDECTVQDFLLLELLHWFKNEFFKWVNTPKCNSCSSESTFYKHRQSSHPWMSKIEVYKCTVCGSDVEFPRYSDPEPLLETRRGRCGEWANVFTLICRTFGYDARFIYDETDHVWTEVWSISNKRWIHLDPCEEAMDTPLIYEKGWGKKLSYVFAFSKDEIQDVTWRYTRDQQSVMKRRNLCSEISLTLLMAKLNNQRLNSLGYSETRKNYIMKRRLTEIVDMLPAPPGAKKPCEESENEQNYQGRISGSLAWRLARGETKTDSAESFKWIIPKTCQTFTLTYYILNDYYQLMEELKGTTKLMTKDCWHSGINQSEGGIFRKVENDWKMVYLARSPDSLQGRLEWCFQTEDESTVISSIELMAICQTFEQGVIHWEISGYFRKTNENKIIVIHDVSKFQTEELDGAIRISVSATLSKGNWQHAQLFRRSLTPDLKHSMFIKIDMKTV